MQALLLSGTGGTHLESYSSNSCQCEFYRTDERCDYCVQHNYEGCSKLETLRINDCKPMNYPSTAVKREPTSYMYNSDINKLIGRKQIFRTITGDKPSKSEGIIKCHNCRALKMEDVSHWKGIQANSISVTFIVSMTFAVLVPVMSIHIA
jgi:hypothetical protein